MNPGKLSRCLLFLWLGVPACLLWVNDLPSHLSTRLAELLPVGEEHGREAGVLRAVSDHFSRQVFVVMDGLESPEDRRHATRLLEEFTENNDLFTRVLVATPEAWPRQWGELLLQNQMLFFPSWLHDRERTYQEESGGRLWPEWLAEDQVQAIEAFLETPEGMTYAGILPRDPLLLVPYAMAGLADSALPELGSSRLAWIGLSGDPLNSVQQALITDALAELQAVFEQALPAISLRMTGVYAVALESEQASRKEVFRLNLLTISAVVGLLLVLMRSARGVLMPLLPLTAAVLWALLAGVALLPCIHVFALAMSSVLLGLAVDYGLHAEVYHASGDKTRSTWASVRRPLLAACLSTCIGFLLMRLTPLPALRQMAVLAPAGLLGAMVAVYLVYGGRPVGKRLPVALRLAFPSLRSRSLMAVLVLSGIVFAVLIFLRAHREDAIGDFQPEGLVAQQHLADLASLSALNGSTENWIIYGSSYDEWFERMTAIKEHLIEIALPLDLMRPPLADPLGDGNQRESFMRAFWSELDQAGYEVEAFSAFGESFARGDTRRDFEHAARSLASSSVGPSSWVFGYQNGFFFSVLALTHEQVSSLEDVTMIRQAERERFDELITASSRAVAIKCLLAWPFILLIACLVFGARRGLWVACLPLWAVAGGALLATWPGGGFSLMTTIGLALAYCLALDYCGFAVSDHSGPISSVRVSALTTLAAFGMLAFSTIPALADLGRTVFLSVLLAWLGAECLSGLFNQPRRNKVLPEACLPHRPPMLLLSHILSWQEDAISAEAILDRSYWGDSPSSAWALEILAQAGAVLISRDSPSTSARQGRLVRAQTFSATCLTLPVGTPLEAEVTLTGHSDMGIYLFSGRLRAGGDLLAESTFTIMVV